MAKGKFKFPLLENESKIDRRNRLARMRFAKDAEQKKNRTVKAIAAASRGISKGTALAILHFLGNNLHQAAMITGIDPRVLTQWGVEFDPEFLMKGIEGDSTDRVLRNYLECLAVFGLMKASAGDLSDINAAMEIASKLISKREAPTKRQPAADPVATAPGPDTAVSAPTAEERPPMTEESQKTKWERIVRQSISDSRNRDTPMTRDEAIASLIAQRPEAAAYLSPAPIEVEEPKEDEDVPGYSN